MQSSVRCRVSAAQSDYRLEIFDRQYLLRLANSHRHATATIGVFELRMGLTRMSGEQTGVILGKLGYDPLTVLRWCLEDLV